MAQTSLISISLKLYQNTPRGRERKGQGGSLTDKRLVEIVRGKVMAHEDFCTRIRWNGRAGEVKGVLGVRYEPAVGSEEGRCWLVDLLKAIAGVSDGPRRDFGILLSLCDMFVIVVKLIVMRGRI